MNESREAVCDDWVLTRGQAEPAAYSADLLTIVRQHFHQGKVTTGMAMAQSSKVGNRVRCLLDHSISRAPLTTGQRLLLTAAGLLTLATATLLISCRTTRPSTAETAAPPINSPLPYGAKLITYEVHFIEKEPGVDWPGKQVPPTQTWIGEVAMENSIYRCTRTRKNCLGPAGAADLRSWRVDEVADSQVPTSQVAASGLLSRR